MSTKIVATLGPASWSEEGIAALAQAGADVFRVNCSHSGPEQVREILRRVRSAAPEIGVLVDLQGPKLRLGEITCEVRTGEKVRLGAGAQLPVSFSPAKLGVEPGQRVLLNDGKVELRVVDVDGEELWAEVVVGGLLTARKGVNLPDTKVNTSPITAQDEAHAAVAVAEGAEWVALSFVQHPSDVEELVRICGGKVRVMAKVERPQVLEHLEELCLVSDAVMAARGDLGVELAFEQVPGVQRRIAQEALRAGTLSVCATEMLESMIHSVRPTRAEVSDVAAAIREGFDAVMLSAETATGAHPVGAVTAMRRIADANPVEGSGSPFANAHPELSAVPAAAAALAARMDARAIVALSMTGYSPSLIAACRPPVPVLAVTPSWQVARTLRLRHGVTPVVSERAGRFEDAAETALVAVRDAGLVCGGEIVVLCASRTSPRSSADTLWTAVVPR